MLGFDSSCRRRPQDGFRSHLWSRCSGSWAPRAMDSMVFWRQNSLVGWMLARTIVRWSETQASNHYAHGVIHWLVSEGSVNIRTPNNCAVLSIRID